MAKQKESKADVIRAFLKKYPDGTKADLEAQVGYEFSNSQFYTLKKEMQEGQTSTKKTKSKQSSSSNSKDKAYIAKLEKRIRFLEWLRIGESEGFVDTFLEEYAE